MRNRTRVVVLLLTFLSSAPSQSQPATTSAQAGYLPRESLPNSLTLLPAPPEMGSAAYWVDEEASRNAAFLRGTQRWQRAVSDADLSFPKAGDVFACAMDIAVGEQATPRLYTLLRRAFYDIGLSTYAAKNYYQRVRPFVAHDTASCTPGDEAMLRTDGSYPSGHTALGWGWALILAELDPDHTDAILARGREFGQSRVVCNAHWKSDVDAGRLIASAAVARLHADPAFQADMQAARQEIAEAHRSGAGPQRDCAAEAASFGAN